MEPTNEQYVEQVIRQRFPDLNEIQVDRVKEMAIAFSEKNQGRLPSIEGYVNLVRSSPERLTPITKEDKGERPGATGGTFIGSEGARTELFESAPYAASHPGCGLKASALQDFKDRVVVSGGPTKSILKSLGDAASFWTKK